MGLDIGSQTLKLVQVKGAGKHAEVVAYGHADFAPEAVVEGVVVDPENLAKVVRTILSTGSKSGRFNGRSLAMALPVAKVFTRALQFPAMEEKDIAEAVKLEAEQSIPVPPTDLYMDFEVMGTTKTEKGEAHIDVLMVAAPRAIVDSYLRLATALKLDLAAVEISLMSVARALKASGQATGPLLLIDFGSNSADLAIWDSEIRLTGTIAMGGRQVTATLVKTLGITAEQANEIKYKFGIGPSGLQSKVQTAIQPLLKSLISEVNKAIKYYADRNADKAIGQIVVSGGSANMPGLREFLAKNLKAQIIAADPWAKLGASGKRPDETQAPMYTTAIGLALLEVTA